MTDESAISIPDYMFDVAKVEQWGDEWEKEISKSEEETFELGFMAGWNWHHDFKSREGKL